MCTCTELFPMLQYVYVYTHIMCIFFPVRTYTHTYFVPEKHILMHYINTQSLISIQAHRNINTHKQYCVRGFFPVLHSFQAASPSSDGVPFTFSSHFLQL